MNHKVKDLSIETLLMIARYRPLSELKEHYEPIHIYELLYLSKFEFDGIPVDNMKFLNDCIEEHRREEYEEECRCEEYIEEIYNHSSRYRGGNDEY